MPTTYRGTIEQFSGSWGSGLGSLLISGRLVTCENAQTVRSLDACFGNVIAPNHSVNQDAIRGQEVIYSVDDIGVLLGFTPIDEWTGPDIPPEGIEDDQEDESDADFSAEIADRL
jgi:hypothetical protein